MSQNRDRDRDLYLSLLKKLIDAELTKYAPAVLYYIKAALEMFT